MAKNDQQEAFEKLLSAALARVIDFVKYGETKNAALLTFSSAWILAILNILSKLEASQSLWLWCGPLAIIAFTVAALIAIRAFLPRKLEHIFKDPDGEKSLIYFEHIAGYETSKYVTLVREKYCPMGDNSTTDKYLNDLSVQISINSRVASRKFSFFNFGAIAAVIGILFLIIPALAPIAQTLWHWAAKGT